MFSNLLSCSEAHWCTIQPKKYNKENVHLKLDICIVFSKQSVKLLTVLAWWQIAHGLIIVYLNKNLFLALNLIFHWQSFLQLIETSCQFIHSLPLTTICGLLSFRQNNWWNYLAWSSSLRFPSSLRGGVHVNVLLSNFLC